METVSGNVQGINTFGRLCMYLNFMTDSPGSRVIRCESSVFGRFSGWRGINSVAKRGWKSDPDPVLSMQLARVDIQKWQALAVYTHASRPHQATSGRRRNICMYQRSNVSPSFPLAKTAAVYCQRELQYSRLTNLF